ncbi:unnamed protein product [Gadus morhua 'NCC']
MRRWDQKENQETLVCRAVQGRMAPKGRVESRKTGDPKEDEDPWEKMSEHCS